MNILFIDIRTIFLSYTIINVLNAFLIGFLYLQIRKKFPKSFLIFLSFLFSSFGNTLLFFRDNLFEWAPIIGNTLVVSSTVILLIGLEHFVNKRGIQIQNYILIIVFLLVQSYFTFIEPNISIRSLIISITYVLLSAQIVWLMLVRVPVFTRKITRGVGLVFCALLGVQIARIMVIVFTQHQATNYFNLDNSEGLFLIIYEVILIMLTYSISLMYNKSLIIDIKKQEKKNIILYKEKRQLELDLINKELSQKELYIASMKEFNKNILNELEDNLNRRLEVPNSNIHEVIRKIKSSTQKSKIWEEFDVRFKESNSKFYQKLSKDYPSLTPNEIRVTCLIHQNYNTKEIAEILQRSTKTIENIRVLIRKKMELRKDENLTLFLTSIT